jgi:hypothetical protein
MLNEQEAKRLLNEKEAKKKSEDDDLHTMQEAEIVEKQQILEQQKEIHDAWLAQQQELKNKMRVDFDLIRAQEHESYMMYFNDVADEINAEYNLWQVHIFL